MADQKTVDTICIALLYAADKLEHARDGPAFRCHEGRLDESWDGVQAFYAATWEVAEALRSAVKLMREDRENG